MFEIQEVDGPSVAFGGNMERLLPDYAAIPPEFKDGDTKWNQLFSAWFYGGLKDLKLKARDGVDEKKALRHIRAVMVSFQPKHEHKEAGVAFLLSQWFEDATWERAK